MEHYSESLQRNFQDDDWITIAEVKEIISATSGRSVGIGTVGSYLRRRSDIHKREVNANVKLYLYGEIKDIQIADQRGRRRLSEPSSNVLRQRAFQARKRQKKEREMRGQADASSPAS